MPGCTSYGAWEAGRRIRFPEITCSVFPHVVQSLFHLQCGRGWFGTKLGYNYCTASARPDPRGHRANQLRSWPRAHARMPDSHICVPWPRGGVRSHTGLPNSVGSPPLSLSPPEGFGFPMDSSPERGLRCLCPAPRQAFPGPRHRCAPDVRLISSGLRAANGSSSCLLVLLC